MAPPPYALLTFTAFLALFITALLTCTLRLLAILPDGRPPPKTRVPGTPTRLLIVLGSGGHTREMILMLRDLDTSKYTHRTYVISSGDAFSAERAVEFESELEVAERTKTERKEENGTWKVNGKDEKERGATATETHNRTSFVGDGCYDIAIVPRARNVHQSLFTTPFSALNCLSRCFTVLARPSTRAPSSPSNLDYPDLILTNGPGTAVILILASIILRFFDIRGAQSRGKMRTIYVESFARVTSLSLSGKLLIRVVNRFLVQWEQLEGVGGRGEYHGVLV